jgi:hypothetical protein
MSFVRLLSEGWNSELCIFNSNDALPSPRLDFAAQGGFTDFIVEEMRVIQNHPPYCLKHGNTEIATGRVKLYVRVKEEVKSQCLTKYHAMKTYPLLN